MFLVITKQTALPPAFFFIEIRTRNIFFFTWPNIVLLDTLVYAHNLRHHREICHQSIRFKNFIKVLQNSRSKNEQLLVAN